MEHEQNQTMVREQGQRLKDYLNQTKGSRYPFTRHWLGTQENYVKNSWLKMLCMILQQGKAVSEEQTLFLQRLTAGCKAECDLQTYLRQGIEITPEVLEEFITLLLDDTNGDSDKKRYIFVTDALLLIRLGPADEDGDADELLGQICEALLFTPKELTRVAVGCAGVLKMSLAECALSGAGGDVDDPFMDIWSVYLSACEDNEIEFLNTGEYYIKTANQLTDVAINSDTSSAAFRCSLRDGDGSAGGSGAYIQDKSIICLWNLKIDMTQHLRICDTKKVVFVNCEFIGDTQKTGIDAPSIWFDKCKSVEIYGCTFQDFKGRTIYAVGETDILIQNSAFLDCSINYYSTSSDWSELGGVVYGVSTETQLVLDHTDFTNCGGRNSANYYRSSIISNCRTTIKNCSFVNCRHYHRGSEFDPVSSYRCLFRNIVSESGNTLTNSAELGPH